MLSRLGKMSITIQIILRTDIILIAADVLGFFVHQCVLSFCLYLQYGLMLLLSRSSDQSINTVVGSCKTLAARGLKELFFQLCCCVSFWFWRGMVFGFTYLCT
jgi:hypothetical protein